MNKLKLFAVSALFSLCAVSTAFAANWLEHNARKGNTNYKTGDYWYVEHSGGSWQENEKGRWWVKDDGSYAVNEDLWIDADGDNHYESYGFDQNGYLIIDENAENVYDRTDAEGRQLDASTGKPWSIYDLPSVTAADLGLPLEDENYNKYGVSRAAIDLLEHDQAENSKYGELSGTYVVPIHGFGKDGIRYANGLVRSIDPTDVLYTVNGYVTVDPSVTGGTYQPLLKFYYDTHKLSSHDDVIEKANIMEELGMWSVIRCGDHAWGYFEDNGKVYQLCWYCTNEVFIFEAKGIKRTA